MKQSSFRFLICVLCIFLMFPFAQARQTSVFLDSADWCALSGPLGYQTLSYKNRAGLLSITPFFARTTPRGGRQIAERFGYMGKGSCDAPIYFSNKIDELGNDYGLLEVGADVHAIHFNVNTTDSDVFRSTVFFKPTSALFGLNCVLHTPIRSWEGGDLWVDLRAPFVARKNKLSLQEVVNTGGSAAVTTAQGLDSSPFVTNISDGVTQHNWRFGKMDVGCCAPDDLELWGLGDTEFALGYSADCCHALHFDCFVGAVVPGDSSQDGSWMYKPILGNGGHAGFLVGAGAAGTLFENDVISCGIRMVADMRYLFARKQWRSFDIMGKPWSRYIGLFSSYNQAMRLSSQDSGTSGINHLTRQVVIYPGIRASATCAFELSSEYTTVAFGCMARAQEQEAIGSTVTPGGAIKSSSFLLSKLLSRTRNMHDTVHRGDLPLSLWNRAELTAQDIDLLSGTMEADLSGGLFASIEYTDTERSHPISLQAGCFVDGLFGATIAQKWGLFGSLSLGL